MASTHPTSSEKSKSRPELLSFDQVESWQKDNDYILTGYRAASHSLRRSMTSITELHNETANIWSHLLGMLAFLIGMYDFCFDIAATALEVPVNDVIAVATYYGCVVVCFLLSTFFHTTADHSAPMHKLGNELDHLGIVLVMWGSGVSSTYFGFYCDHNLRNAYILAVTTTAAGCGVFTLRDEFRRPDYRMMRFLMYVFLGSSLFASCVHGLCIYGWTELNQRMSLDHFIGLAIVNFCGAAIYSARIPERWFPKTFDLLGQSHNLMHVLVFTGAMIRLRGLLLTIRYWDDRIRQGVVCS